MSSLGHFSLILSFLLALIGCAAGVYAARRQDANSLAMSRNATLLAGITAFISVFVLAICFVNDDYSLQYVWQYSNRAMPSIYKVTAIWGGMDGSMLLWAMLLTVMAAVVALQLNSVPRKIVPWLLAVVNSSSLFFLGVVVFFTNPFRFLNAAAIPPDGNGLNPLLQNSYMAVHPPMLYLGFTGLSVPFAFCAAALLSKSLGNDWIRLTRRWTLVAWGILTIGIVLGGHWAYVELGWGGFWAWDPVENASFFPWLTATAFLHSVMIQERKNMLKMWNVWLIGLTYILTVFGTFLTRSGVVQSVHAFAETDIGWIFLVYIALLFLSLVILTWSRRGELASERQIESLFSREAAFLLNNLVLLSICFATIWGVMFPVLSEAVTGRKMTVGIPFFNAVNVPLFLGLVLLMAIGPLIAWRRASFRSLRNTFLAPLLSSSLVVALLVWTGIDQFYPLLAYGLSALVVLTVLGEVHRGMRAQRVNAGVGSLAGEAAKLLRRHRARYGGYIVHLGVAIMTVAITASMAHKLEQEFSLREGQSIDLRRFTLTLDKIYSEQNSNYEAVIANVIVSDRSSKEVLGALKPESRFYLLKQERTSEVGLRTTVRDDLYLVLVGIQEDGEAVFKAFVNPLQVWVWVGAMIMAAGTLVVLVPERSRVRSEVRQAGSVEVRA